MTTHRRLFSWYAQFFRSEKKNALKAVKSAQKEKQAELVRLCGLFNYFACGAFSFLLYCLQRLQTRLACIEAGLLGLEASMDSNSRVRIISI